MINTKEKIDAKRNPYIFFIPFLILYIILILIFSRQDLIGDENRYLMYAKNLTNGFYTLPPPYLDLGNGPGYPIIITPFVALKLPLIYIKLLNAIFYYFSIVIMYKALLQIGSSKLALLLSLFWALYPNIFESLYYVLPEIFAFSLIPIIIYTIIKAFKNEENKKSRKYFIFAGLTFGYLALTKPIFGYVLIFMGIGVMILWAFNKYNSNLKKSIFIFVIAFLITLPWLGYTYHMTGKVLYWSSYGGNNLYWMTSPYENELGDWNSFPFDNSNKDISQIHGANEMAILQHKKDFEKIFERKDAQDIYIKNGIIIGSPYTGVIQDEVLKKIALENIKTHPIKFIKNCFSNAGRIIFNYPYSHTLQKPETLLRLPVNGLLLVLILFCIIPTLMNWRIIAYPIKLFIFLGLIYFGGSLFGSAEARMFLPIVPILLIWIAYILPKTIRLNLKWT